MNTKNEEKINKNKTRISLAKECTFLAVMVAILIASQFVLSAVAGVEIVTVLFLSYSFVFGGKRGVAVAGVFAILRQIIFGFFLNVLILYVLYYTILCAVFGGLGKKIKPNGTGLVVIVIFACVCTVFFTLLDCVITPVYLGYSMRAMRIYFLSSLPIMCMQVLNAGITVSLLFLPLERAFALVKRRFL